MADKYTPHSGAKQPDATNLADTRQHSEHNKIVWSTDIFERIVEPTPHIKEFFDHFVPVSSSRDVPQCPDKEFAAEVPTGHGKEPRMYEPLIAGLTSLVRNFEANVKPTFHNRANEILKPPFALCDDTEHQTKPDIVVTVPKLPQLLLPQQRWRNVAFVFEAKAEASDDPVEKYSKQHETTLIQLAKSARNIMLAQGRLYAYAVGVYGDQARIFRFDRAGAVCSPLFDYVIHPEYMHDFIWRFVHPSGEGCVVLDDDPTVSLGTARDRGFARRIAKEHDPSYQHTEENQKAIRRFEINDEHGNEKEYLAYKLLFLNSRMFSRGSMIWEAFELDTEGAATGVHVVIKEAWRQFERPSEIRHYRDLQEAAETAAEGAAEFLSGFADFLCGDDLGLRETRELAMAGHGVTPDKTAFRGSVDTLDEHRLQELAFPPSVVPGHRTVSACCRHAKPELERGHIRLVLKTIGKPITDFLSTYEMTRALRDSIKSHKRAYEAGILHRDISSGNVMFVRRPDGSIHGFLHDFDYASNWMRFLADIHGYDTSLDGWRAYTLDEYKKDMAKRKERLGASAGGTDTKTSPDANADEDEDGDEDEDDDELEQQSSGSSLPNGQGELQDLPRTPGGSTDAPHTPGESQSMEEQRKEEQKQRTGTIYFMAIEIRDKNFRITHEARHDLESFYWLLVWIVLRHTAHECDWTWHDLFDCRTSSRALSVKQAWLTGPERRIKVIGNEPLSNLLESFRKLCQNNAYMQKPEQRMTHKKVLRLFSIALKDRKQWPRTAVDNARPWVMPDTRPGDNPQPSGQLRSKGTLAFSSAALDEHEPPCVVPDDVLPTFRGITAPARTAEGQDEQTDVESSTDMEDAPIGKDKGKGKAPARKAVARRPVRSRPLVVAPKTCGAMSQASGSHEAPPSSEEASVSHGSASAQACHGSRSAAKETARSSGRSTTRGMGPPPVPATRSSRSRSQAPSRLASTRQRSPHRSRATKRSRSREDEVADIRRSGAGSSHSPKRPRTLSQPGPASPKGSRKAKGKKRA